MKSAPLRILSRYTTLPVLLDVLQRRKLTLLDPKLWDDRNDAEIILEYKKRKKITNLFALCFSSGDETIHHWKTFSNGTSGCVIEFDAVKLMAILEQHPAVRHGKVTYRKLSEIEKKDVAVDVERIPFTKRWPYRCEEEYRLIAVSDGPETSYEIDIPLEIIRRITLSQQMPQPIFTTIKGYLKGLKGNPDSKIHRSTLYENKRWINHFKTGSAG